MRRYEKGQPSGNARDTSTSGAGRNVGKREWSGEIFETGREGCISPVGAVGEFQGDYHIFDKVWPVQVRCL